MNICKKLETIRKKAKAELSQESRSSKAALTGVVTILVKGLTIGTGLLSIPITATYLGKEQFGVWLLLSTFMNWISLADLGLTNSLVNILATAIANGDKKTAKESVASAFFPMVLLSLLISSTSIFLSFFIHFDEMLNIHLSSSSLQQDTRLAITIAMCFFAIKIPLSIPRCIFNAYQQGYIYQLWAGLGNILSLLSLFLAQYYHASLPWLLAVFFGMVILGEALAGIDVFYFRQGWLKPAIKNCDPRSFGILLKVGFQFWIAQISAICIFQTDLLIVSNLFGVVEVGIYGVLLRLFSTIEAVSSSFTNPLWPAYSEAQAIGDYEWIKKTFWNSVIGSFVWSISTGTVLVLLSPTLLKHLISQDIELPVEIPLSMLLTYVLLCTSQCIAMLVNGLGRIKIQSFLGPVSAVANIVLSITLAKIIGIQGVTLATSLCILIFSVILVGGDALLIMYKKKC